MNIYTFVKKNGGWKVYSSSHSSPERNYTGMPRVEGAETILNFMSAGANKVTLAMNTEPFEQASTLELLQSCQPFLDGGYYVLREYEGKEINYQMWLSDVTRYIFGDIPDKIYIRKVQH